MLIRLLMLTQLSMSNSTTDNQLTTIDVQLKQYLTQLLMFTSTPDDQLTVVHVQLDCSRCNPTINVQLDRSTCKQDSSSSLHSYTRNVVKYLICSYMLLPRVNLCLYTCFSSILLMSASLQDLIAEVGVIENLGW